MTAPRDDHPQLPAVIETASVSPPLTALLALDDTATGPDGTVGIHPLRYAYQWSDTRTGASRIVTAVSRDDAYESVAGIRAVQLRARRLADARVLSGIRPGRWIDRDLTPPVATGESSLYGVDIAAQMCREILDDIADGVIPADVGDFAELHDHVDANTYADGHITARQNLSGQRYSDFIVPVQNLVTCWLRAGRPPTGFERQSRHHLSANFDTTRPSAGFVSAKSDTTVEVAE